MRGFVVVPISIFVRHYAEHAMILATLLVNHAWSPGTSGRYPFLHVDEDIGQLAAIRPMVSAVLPLPHLAHVDFRPGRRTGKSCRS